ncbi:hypothetical protein CPB84DRAFT_217574 [Gymnopilus junonius]|uniref:Uncharacterized protein n=1 Tax=Gymnopilus junonius TaxID=109634 RepID=A0A9P5NGN5_GYMJU|nr:hypothetical protein CPB84DRAFT_217574 [Gymnopilus junonius]
MNPNDFQRHLANSPRLVAQDIFNDEDSLDITSFRPILVVTPETTRDNPSHSPESSFMCSPAPPSQSVQDPNDGLTQNVLPINHTVQKEFEGSLWYFRPLQHRIFPRSGTMSGDSKPPSKIVRGEIVLSNNPSSTNFFTTYHLCKRPKHELLTVLPNNKEALHEVIRNQAMLALTVGTGPPLFDELRTLCWSDLTLHNVVLPGSILKQAVRTRLETSTGDIWP